MTKKASLSICLFQKSVSCSFIFIFFIKKSGQPLGKDESAVTHQAEEPSLRVSAPNLCASLKSINACDVITFYKDTGDKLNFYTVLP